MCNRSISNKIRITDLPNERYLKKLCITRFNNFRKKQQWQSQSFVFDHLKPEKSESITSRAGPEPLGGYGQRLSQPPPNVAKAFSGGVQMLSMSS